MNTALARRLAVAAAVLLAVVEVLSTAWADVPLIMGVFFALLLLAAAVLMARQVTVGVWLMAAVSLLEVAGFFMYERGDAVTWALQVGALVLGALGLGACTALLSRSRATTSSGASRA